jgi:hypothetical protein
MDRGGNLKRCDGVSEAMAAALAGQCADLEKPTDGFLEEERIALRSLEEEPLERVEGRVRPEQSAE